MKRCYIAQVEEKISTKAYPMLLDRLKENGQQIEPVLIIFTSDNANFSWYSRMLSNSFPGAVVIGATSNVMYSPLGVSRVGISVMAITSGISVTCGALFNVSRYPGRSSDSITSALEDIDKENTVCLEFNASVGNCEELVMDTFREAMGDTGIPICGCTAAVAENPERQSAVSLNGIPYVDACVFAIIHNEMGRVGVIKENIFRPTEHFFTATDVDCDARRVYEFDHKPATGVVASAMQIPVDELMVNSFFHPLGRVENGDLNTIAVHKADEKDMSMSFFSRIYNQTRVSLLEPIDPIEDVWAQTSARVHELIPDPSFSFVINCFLRMRYFTEMGKMLDYNDTLARDYGDFIGASAYGEQFLYKHINQTMLILVFE